MGLINKFQEINDLEVSFNEPMKNHTTLKLGGDAKYYLRPFSLLAVKNALEIINDNKLNYKVIGNGSNLLVSDLGFDGVIIDTKNLNSVNINKNVITASCGFKLIDLSYLAYSLSLTGLEALSSIPACVGGAVTMNAGAFGHFISDRLDSVCVLQNGKIKTLGNKDCGFSYRKSKFLHKNTFIVSATFNFEYLDKQTIKNDMDYYRSLRSATQPKGRTNGSIFKNTKNFSAGKLIEMSGLKGYKYKDVGISDVHANFLSLGNNATSKDVYYLIQYVKKRVYDVFDVLLEEEIEYIGDF